MGQDAEFGLFVFVGDVSKHKEGFLFITWKQLVLKCISERAKKDVYKPSSHRQVAKIQ